MGTALKTKFYGMVHFKEWMKLGNGKSYTGVVGYVHVMKSEDAVGFTPGDKESNWLVAVTQNAEAKEDEPTIVILGCQIRSFESGTRSAGVDGEYDRDKDFYTMGRER